MYYKVIDNNKKKWILLLHCICANMHIFDTYLDELSKKYNILLVDLPGHGKSRTIQSNIEFQGIVKEIFEIMEDINIEKITVWGISLGGVIAKYMLEYDSKKIEKIIFEGPAFMIENIFLRMLFKIFNVIKPVLPKKRYLRAFIYAVIPSKNMKKIRQKMYEMLEDANYKIIAQWLTKLEKEYTKKDLNVLNKSKVSKIYMVGSKDYIFKNGVVKNINNNKYNEIILKKECGHLCHLETKIFI